jgi:hypothetical protein
MGVVLLEPVLFAMWAMLGPPPALYRLPATAGAFGVIVFAGAFTHPGWFSADYVVIAVAFFSVTAVLMFVTAAITRWSIRDGEEALSPGTVVNQFSLRYLISITTLCAVLLGAGRVMASLRDIPESSLPNQISQILAPLGLLLLVTFPAILLPLLILSQRPRLIVFVLFGLVWLGLSWLAVETIFVNFGGMERTEIAYDIASIQLGAGVTSGLAAVLIRFGGYRLVKWQRGEALPAAS